MKTTRLLLACVFALGACNGPKRSEEPEAVLRVDGRLVLFDNASYYVFRSDGAFESFPAGMSGRTFRGTWKATQSMPMNIEVIAEMAWDNGMSGPGDYHRIVFSIYAGPMRSHNGPHQITKVFDGYYIISTLSRVTKASPSAASTPDKP